MLTLILGGARSGKSRLAQNLAAPAGRITYVATARAGTDHEMSARIEHHRASRPAAWQTIEEPVSLADAVTIAVATADAVLVDCLTVWLSNLFWEHRDCVAGHVETIARTQIEQIAKSSLRKPIFLVSNELGSGTVPEAALTRAFRDAQGFLNQRTAELSDEVILTVAGLPLYLKKAAV